MLLWLYVLFIGDAASLIVTFVLCLYFDLSDLAQNTLSVIKHKLTGPQAKELLPYAQTLQCQPLMDVCNTIIRM